MIVPHILSHCKNVEKTKEHPHEWDDDFNFKKEKQQENNDTYRDPLWIDFFSDGDNIEILEVNTKYMKTDDVIFLFVTCLYFNDYVIISTRQENGHLKYTFVLNHTG